jgi:hypothetical protein
MKEFEGYIRRLYLSIEDKFVHFDDKMRKIGWLIIPYSLLRMLFIIIFGLIEILVMIAYNIIKGIITLAQNCGLYLLKTPVRVKENFLLKKEKRKTRLPFKERFKKHLYQWKVSLKRDWILYLLFLPVFIWLIVFRYMPKLGLIIAFKDYNVFQGIWNSPWAEKSGFQHFYSFFNNPYFGKLIYNTLMINVYSLIFIFPLPIILALMINEVKKKWFKKTTQTIVFLPYFISTIVIVSIFMKFMKAYFYHFSLLEIALGLLSGHPMPKYRPEATIFGYTQLLKGWTVMDRLGEIHVPTLVIAGRHCFLFPTEHQVAVAAGIPDARLRIINQYIFECRYGNFYLTFIRLSGGNFLQPHPRCRYHTGKPAAAPSGPFYYFIGYTCNYRQQQYPYKQPHKNV